MRVCRSVDHPSTQHESQRGTAHQHGVRDKEISGMRELKNWRQQIRSSLLGITALATLLLHGCAYTPSYSSGKSPTTQTGADGAPIGYVNFDAIPDAVPTNGPPAKWGNKPYKVFGKQYKVMASNQGFEQRGLASWYGTKYHGRTTSSGDVYDMYAMTAAHTSLPLPTYAEVTNLNNNRTVIVKINDRGPFHGDRVLDLSYAAAGKLGILGSGVAPVSIRAINTSGTSRMASSPPPPAAPQSKAKVAKQERKEYILQIGTFSDQDNANILRTDLERSLGYAIQVRSGNSGPRPVYKVQIGPFDHSEAKNATFRLAQLGYTDTRLIIN